MRRAPLMILCGVLVWSSLAYARYIGPTANGYYFHAHALPSEIYLPNQMFDPMGGQEFATSATIVVHVRDVNRERVDGLPVTLQLGADCQGVAVLSATRAVTRHGTARASVTGKDTGTCHIAVRVDNVTQEIWVDVSPAPALPSIPSR